MTRRDGEDDDPAAPAGTHRRRIGANATSETLREMLRECGIEIDDDKPKRAAFPIAPVAVDRARIYATLEPLGVPEWMIASCPSIDLAIAYAKKHTEGK